MKFYEENGNPLSKKEFISHYNARYFTDCAAKVSYKTDAYITCSVRRSSRFVENIIEKILNKEPKDFTYSDVALMLAWKIGKIAHTKSEDKIILHKDWKETLGEYSKSEGFNSWNGEPIKLFGEKSPIAIDIKEITEYLHENGQHLNDLVGNGNIEAALDELRKQPWQGIGAVYLITLLYSATNHQHPGKCPIYDRFAMRVLLAINGDKKISDAVKCGELPDKKSKKFPETVGEKMKQYIGLISDIFGAEYNINRDIDRALWVYGHLFKDSITAQKC